MLLNLLTSFFFTTTGDKPFSSGLVHFLAVLGIDSDTNRLRTAKNYSYMLAGVVYCMRVLSVEKLLLPPRDRRDPGLIRAQYGIVHDFGPESPPFSLSLELTPFCDLIRFSSTLHGRVCSVKLHL